MAALKLLDERRIVCANQENVRDIQVNVILATTVGQCQGDGQVEVECYRIQHPVPNPGSESVLEHITYSLVSLNDSDQVEEQLEKLRDEICNGEDTGRHPQAEVSIQGSCQSQMLLMFNNHTDGSDPAVGDLTELLEHFQTILSCHIEGTVSTFRLWGLASRQNENDALLDSILAILQRLTSERKPNLTRDLFALTSVDPEWKEKALTTKHHNLNSRFVHDLFAETALAQPSALAVDAWDGTMTYRELQEVSDTISIRLKNMSVGAEVVVPLLFEKTRWTVVIMLSVLKAGGAFLFLDPAHPAPRLRSIIDRVGASFSITSSELLSRLESLERPLITVESLCESLSSQNAPSSGTTVSPENAAFLLFTSGSTGEPKGVVTEHRGLSSGIIQQAHGLGIDKRSRVMQGSMFSFAAAIVEMLFTVVVGGCVCIPTLAERFDDFPGAFNKMKATFGIFPPSYTAITDPRSFKTLQVAVVGSEALMKKAVTAWMECFDVRHGYGTSEVNTINAAISLRREDLNLRSIGKGFAHNFWVVDARNHDRLLRDGFAGEVLIESPAIARGYLDNKTATAKAFVPPPTWYLEMFGDVPHGTKFYKTGDLGKIIEGGEIEIHGRTDALQVKLRGQRIELGEVEACSLNALPPGSHVFAELVLPISQSRPHLALFYVVHASHLDEVDGTDDFISPASVSDNLRHLMQTEKEVLTQSWQKYLPSFMRPSYVIPLRRIPRLTTGKIGRKLMREWASQYTVQDLQSFTSSANGDTATVPLQGDKEEKLSRAWRTTFNVSMDAMHANSDFFDLGGDSLSAMRLVQTARDMGLGLRVADVVELHNFRRIAQTASELSPVEASPEVEHDCVPEQLPSISVAAQKLNLPPSDIECVLAATDFQSRAIRLGSGSEKSLIYHFVVSAETNEGFDVARLTSAFQNLVQRHDSLRTAFFEHEGGEIFQAVLRHAEIPVETVDADRKDNDDSGTSKLLIDRMASSGLRLDSIPTRFWIVKSAEGKANKFVIRLSHAQFDGVSLPILWRSLSSLYSKRVLEPAPLFSQYVKAVLSTDRDRAISYFRGLLKDVPFTDVLRHQLEGHHPQDRFLRRSFVLPIFPFTPSVLFEAAWGYVLFKHTDNSAVTFDHTVSGRQLSTPDLNVMNVVGGCLNDVPVCVHFRAEMSVRELLSQIQAQHVASAQHETLGFNSILSECKPPHWPKEGRMTSSVQFQGFDQVTEIELEGTTCKIEMVENSMDLEDFTVLVEPARRKVAREYDVVFASSSETCSGTDASQIFNLFSETIERFCSDIDAQV